MLSLEITGEKKNGDVRPYISVDLGRQVHIVVYREVSLGVNLSSPFIMLPSGASSVKCLHLQKVSSSLK